MLEIFNLSFETSFDNFINFLNSIRDHVRYIAFETLQIELYRVVDYVASGRPNFRRIILEILLILF